ncbi:MAG: hypothetical protein JO130_16115, partial [Solirubrobacterales bacterium]|nr:hypothetical protein [Solirubrobacterales bacterium]
MTQFPRRRMLAALLTVFALAGLAASGSSAARPRTRASADKRPRVASSQPWQNQDQPPLVRADELLA